MRIIANFLIALTFISRLPVKISNRLFEKGNIKDSIIFFPVVGYLPGVIYFAFLSFSKDILVRSLSVVLVFWLFDLFHFDGLLDTFDGFFNQSNKERRLEIMSKGNVGPFAVFFGTLYVITLWELTKISNPISFLFSSIFGRWAMDLMIVITKPAKNTGLGKMLYPNKTINAFYSFLFTIPLVFINFKIFFVTFFVTVVTVLIFRKIAYQKIGGVTGDVLGATHLIVSMAILLTMHFVFRS